MKRTKSFFIRAKQIYQEEGVKHLIYMGIRRVIDYIDCYYWRTMRSSRSFTFQGHAFKYLYHVYNSTFRNERAVEVPIIWETLKNHSGEKVLEIGNVLSHYFHVDHDILDKYELARGVINQDIVDFDPPTTYNLIISISTFEHIGYDEIPQERSKILRAVLHLRELLASGGKIIFTAPVGYNTEFDTLLMKGTLELTKLFCLKRTSADNIWVEVDWEDIRQVKYSYPFPGANGLVVGVIDGK